MVSPTRSFVLLFQHLKNDGLLNTVAVIAKNLPQPLYYWLVRRRARIHERFDRKYSVDTQIPVQVRELETSAPGARFANRYEGTPIVALHKILRRLKVDTRGFTFVDLGSGKGRVLLIAAQYPFKTVIGVEFSNKLHEIAMENIAQFSRSGLIRTSLTSINCDAGEFDFTKLGNKVIFCYNSFAPELMIRVLENVLSRTPESEEILFIYLGPMPHIISEKLAPFKILAKGEFLSEFGFFEQYSIRKLR